MASIYKKTRDKGRKNAAWHVNYTDHLGKRRTVKGFTDRRATEQMAAKLDHEVMLRKRGLIDPEKERELELRSSALEKHLKEFEKGLSDNTPKYIKQTMNRIRRVIKGCKFETISDIKLDSVESFVRDFCEEEKLGRRTYNHYIQAVDGFCNWMVLTRRVGMNPLLGLERLNADVDIRHKRRALSGDEVAKLIKSARESGEEIQCYDGETRARIYILAYFTGLRRGELASLTPASFRLDGTNPTVTVQAACSKHRREDVLPLHPELVQALRV
jgi:integrase